MSLSVRRLFGSIANNALTSSVQGGYGSYHFLRGTYILSAAFQILVTEGYRLGLWGNSQASQTNAAAGRTRRVH